jgi:hypothetical protein
MATQTGHPRRTRAWNLRPEPTSRYRSNHTLNISCTSTSSKNFSITPFYCEPGLHGAHEKGGAEGQVGYWRRNYLSPVPHVDSFDELNDAFAGFGQTEENRRIGVLPRPKRFSDFDCTANQNVTPALINNLATYQWVKKGEPLCLIGDSGTGKSHLLIGLGSAAAMAGFRVRHALAAKLVNELVEAADEKLLTKTIARYGRVDLLCIDELGYRELDRRGAEMLSQVLTEREKKNCVAIASNESFGKAHLFRRTSARWRRKSTGSRWRFRAADDCSGYQCYQVVGPAVRFLGGNLGAAASADEVGTVLTVKSAAAAATPWVGMQSGAWHVVRMKDEQRGVVVDRVGALRHPRVGDAMVGQVIAGRGDM